MSPHGRQRQRSPPQAEEILAQAGELAAEGYRVLAVADGDVEDPGVKLSLAQFSGLTFLGLAAMSDPPRAEAKDAVAACQRAGITVGMVTGDHPVTARAVAHDLNLLPDDKQVVTGGDLAEAAELGEQALDRLVRGVPWLPRQPGAIAPPSCCRCHRTGGSLRPY